MFLKSMLLFFIIFAVSVIFVSPQVAIAKKSKKGKLSEEETEAIKISVNNLYKKVYSSSLFAPVDNDELFESKIKIDSVILNDSPDSEYDSLVYKLAYILQEREFKEDAVEYYKILTEKFPDSPYAIKASFELRKLGVKIEDEDDEEE